MSDERQREERATDHAEPTEKKQDSGSDRMRLVVELGKTPPNSPATKSEQTRGERYFYLGTQAALVVITGIGIAVALYSLSDLNQNVAETHKQAIAAATQAAIAQQEFELSERPWVSVEPAQISDLTFDGNGAHFSVVFVIKNIGHSPAAHSRLEAQLIIPEAANFVREPLQHQKELCDKLRSSKDGLEFNTSTLFPDITRPIKADLSVNAIELQKGVDDLQKEQNVKTRPFLMNLLVVGCVDYQFEFQKGNHQTGFIYSLRRIDPTTNVGFVIYPQDGTLTKNVIRFEPWPFGAAFYAD